MKLHWETQSSLSPLSHLFAVPERQQILLFSPRLRGKRELGRMHFWVAGFSVDFWGHRLNILLLAAQYFHSQLWDLSEQYSIDNCTTHTIFKKYSELFVTLLYTVQPFQHGCRAQRRGSLNRKEEFVSNRLFRGKNCAKGDFVSESFSPLLPLLFLLLSEENPSGTKKRIWSGGH